MINRRTRAHWKAVVNGDEVRFKYDPKKQVLFVWNRHSKKKRILTNEQISLLAVEPPKPTPPEDPRQIHLPLEAPAA